MRLIAIPAYQAWMIHQETGGCEQIWSRSPVNPEAYDLVLGLKHITDNNQFEVTLYGLVRMLTAEDPLYIDEELFNEFLNVEI